MGRQVLPRRADDDDLARRRFNVICWTYRARLCRALTPDEKELMLLRTYRPNGGQPDLPVEELRAWAEDARDDARPGIAEVAHGMLRALDEFERPLL